MTWAEILERWALVESDLASEYGFDAGDREMMRRMTWRWLRTRITGLLSADTRISRALAPKDSAKRG